MVLKFVIRNLLERPFLNLIKIIGLSLSLSGVLLLVLFLENELTYDRFHSKSDRIFRLTVTDPSVIGGKHFARVSNTEFIPSMAAYFAEIENYVRLAPVRGGVIKHNEEYINVTEAFECDSTFFVVFDSELLEGNRETVLNDPGSMIVSESFAAKVFGKKNPVGQIITLPGGQFYPKNIDFTVRGIMRDFPQNSHFHPDFITTPLDKTIFSGWAWTYLLLSENADPAKITSVFRGFYKSLIENNTGEINIEAHLQNISEIHLHSAKLREIEANSSMSVVYTLSIAALILLLIALANYANLNMGMAVFSDKFLFVSKISGSSARVALKYFITEGLIIVISSAILCLVLVSISNVLIEKHFTINLFKGRLSLTVIVVLLFYSMGILSGILPLLKQGIQNSILFSNYNYLSRPGQRGISKSIIVLQYAISTALIIAVFVISRQTRFALDSSMGVGTDNLICFNDVHTDIQKKFGIFKDELLKYNSIESVSAMFEPPGGEANDMFEFKMEGYTKNEENKTDSYIGVFPCDYSFAGIFRLDFLGGSNFSERSEDNEGSGEYIINESAMKRLQYSNAEEIIGKQFGLISNIEGINIPAGRIIGVVEDFHLSSIKKEVEPLVMFKRKDLWLINFVISFRPGLEKTAQEEIKTVWTKMFPGYPFSYEYVGSMYKAVYRTELLQVNLLTIFTIIALFICSMGLLGLSLLTTQRRTKEIGIRKINGARVSDILVMLNWDLLKWVLLSFLFGFPLAFFAMDKWLENFAYRTPLSWWIFVLAGLTAVSIALLTVSMQSVKTAGRNPVEALRYE